MIIHALHLRPVQIAIPLLLRQLEVLLIAPVEVVLPVEVVVVVPEAPAVEEAVDVPAVVVDDLGLYVC